MRLLIKIFLFSCLASTVFSPLIFSQTVEQSLELQELSKELSQKFQEQQQVAVSKAERLGFPLRQKLPNGIRYELIRFDNKLPIYYMTANSEGATLIKTDEIYSGGNANTSLSGLNQTIGLWDESIPLTTHQEFEDGSGASRITTGLHGDPGGSPISHATLVAGTLIAKGVDSNAKGMAFSGNVDAYNWGNDLSEMSAAAGDNSDPLLVSVHPYQTTAGWAEGRFNELSEPDNNEPFGWYWFGDKSQDDSFLFGYYDETARDWDIIAYQAPNYLIVAAAGNHRGVEPPVGTSDDDIYLYDGSSWKSLTTLGVSRPVKDGGSDGFDSMAGFNLAKNVLSVGAVDGSIGTNFFVNSSWGPTDDGRIKPDVVAKGMGVYSPTAGSNNSYPSSSGPSGTSFSAPMIAGSTALIHEHQQNLNGGEILLSSTVRGLISHTATDLGRPGPDYEYGWGLMNTQKAVEVMSENMTSNRIHIRELTIKDGQTLEFKIKAKGNEPLRTTIAWTDPPIATADIIEYGTRNERTPMLVNDLDIKLTESNNTQHFPYTLDPTAPSSNASPGNNNVDNIEHIYIGNTNAGDLYTVSISHKGSGLSGGAQDFSLIITGNEGINYEQTIAQGTGEGWRFLSSPTETANYSELLSNVWTQGPLNSKDENAASSNANVFLYDGNDYTMVPDLDSSIPVGGGTAVFIFDGDKNKTLSVKGLDHIEDLSVDNLLNTGTGVYTLLGNPFNSTIDFDLFSNLSQLGSVVYVYDHSCNSFSEPDETGGASGGCFRAWSSSNAGSLTDGLIAPFQGFFVYSTGSNPTLTIPERSKSSVGPFYKRKQAQTPNMRIAATINDSYSGSTWLSFTENGTLDKNSYDAPYLYPLDYHPFLSLQTRFKGIGFNIKTLPVSPEDPIVIPLAAEAWQPNKNEQNPGYLPLQGDVELFWPNLENIPEEWSVTLTDHYLGTIIDMKNQSHYKYSTSPQKQFQSSIPYKMELQKAIDKQSENTRFTITIYPNGMLQLAETDLPDSFKLHQNYPNPFNSSTVIKYDLPTKANVTLDVYSVTGKRVAKLVNQTQNPGSYSVPFNAGNLASGIYFYQLKTGNILRTQKMVLLK